MKECRSINNSLRARSISKTYQPAFFHLGECATYQPAIDQSDWPIQTVIVQVIIKHACTAGAVSVGILSRKNSNRRVLWTPGHSYHSESLEVGGGGGGGGGGGSSALCLDMTFSRNLHAIGQASWTRPVQATCHSIAANFPSIRLNEYVRPITDLLRETESLNLAPELLEPDPQSISNVSPLFSLKTFYPPPLLVNLL